MQTATHRCQGRLHCFGEEFEWDGSFERFRMDIVGESFVHAEGAFANLLTVGVTNHAIETKRFRTGRLRTDVLHDTDSSLGLLHAGRCAGKEGACWLFSLRPTFTGDCDAQRRISDPRAKYMPGMKQTRLPRKNKLKSVSLQYTGTVLPRNLCKWQKQNVALQWSITRGRQSHLLPLILA